MIKCGRHTVGAMTENPPPVRNVRGLRLVVVTEDYEAAVDFYRDALGLPEQAAFQGEGDARVTILDAGRATLEIANPAQQLLIDRVEAGGHRSDRIRVAFEVTDTGSSTARLAEAGATVIAPPIVTPWRSLNSRLAAPAGLQLTLFEELEPDDERSARPGLEPDASRQSQSPTPTRLRHLDLKHRFDPAPAAD